MLNIAICRLVLISLLLARFCGAFESAPPESTGLPSKAVLTFVDAVEKEVDALHGMVIVRQGKVVAKGWWVPYQETTPQVLYSLSKSFTSTAIGMAVDEKLISLDDKVVSFFPDDLPPEPSDNLRNMRIRDLLCMGSGNHDDTLGPIKSANDPNWPKIFLAQPVEHEPGTYFKYNTGATYMLSAIISKVTGKNLVSFLEPRLFQPLGITQYAWETDPKGITTGGYGLKVRTETIAKLGQLYLQKGMWDGKRLLSEEWTQLATTKKIDNGNNPNSDWNQGYGYQFWMCRHNAFRGDGAFGQYCIVMPEQQTVIAIHGGLGNMQKVLDLVWQHLLPAMSATALPENAAAQAALADKLQHLLLPPVAVSTVTPAPGIIGTTFALAANEKEFKSITLGQDNSAAFVKIANAHGDQIIHYGGGSWTPGMITFEKELHLPVGATNGPQPIAASGAWQSPEHLRLLLYMNETPFRFQFDFIFKDGTVDLKLEQNVNFGNRKWEFTGKAVQP